MDGTYFLEKFLVEPLFRRASFTLIPFLRSNIRKRIGNFTKVFKIKTFLQKQTIKNEDFTISVDQKKFQ